MAGQFLSPKKLCDDCEFEVQDLFENMNGKIFIGFYCTVSPNLLHRDGNLNVDNESNCIK